MPDAVTTLATFDPWMLVYLTSCAVVLDDGTNERTIRLLDAVRKLIRAMRKL